MTKMLGALRTAVLSALVVSALLLGAVSIHSMSGESPAMAGASHVMGATVMGAPVMADPASAHHHDLGVTALAGHPCVGLCEVSDYLVAVLCVVAAVALALGTILVPRAHAGRGILSSPMRRVLLGMLAVHLPATPSPLQLSISRT